MFRTGLPEMGPRVDQSRGQHEACAIDVDRVFRRSFGKQPGADVDDLLAFGEQPSLRVESGRRVDEARADVSRPPWRGAELPGRRQPGAPVAAS